MTITPVELTAISGFDTTNVTANPAVYSTPSLSAVAGRLYLLFVWGFTAGGTTDPFTVAGGGLGTWTRIAGASGTNISGATDISFGVFYAWSDSPGAAAAITMTFGNDDMTGCGRVLYEIPAGFDRTTVIGQSSKATAGSGTTSTPTLASGTSGSAVIAACCHMVGEGTTVEGGWTEGEDNTGVSPACGITSAYRTDVSDLSCGFSWTTGTESASMIVEVLEEPAAGFVSMF